MAAAAQLAAMMTNPLLYNYQAMAMAAMQQTTAAGGGKSSPSSTSGAGGVAGSGSANNNSAATNQMLEIQRQATEHLQRQYLLDMIPPGSLAQNWSSKK